MITSGYNSYFENFGSMDMLLSVWGSCKLGVCYGLVEYLNVLFLDLSFCANSLLINETVCLCWVSFSHGMKEHARRQRRYGIAWCWFIGATQTQSTRGPPPRMMLITGISFHQSGAATILATTLRKTLFYQHGNIQTHFRSYRTSQLGIWGFGKCQEKIAAFVEHFISNT